MSDKFKLDLVRRPRRLRRTESIRALVKEHVVRVDDLIAPLFVIDGEGEPETVESMPGVLRLTLSLLQKECLELSSLGVRSVALFPCIESSLKDEEGSNALAPDTLILRAVRAVRDVCPGMVIITDIALDPYTTHGHDGVLLLDGSDVDNDRTVGILREMAVLHAAAGVSVVAPSDMMDGRIGAIREALDDAGFQSTGILAYSAKYASAYYGPFRDAVGSAKAAGTTLLGKETYQLSPANRREALIESRSDEEEGADMLMVKPAGAYLDIIRDLSEDSLLPIAAYQVSGEYAQIHAAARLGWLDLEKIRDESLLAIKRAGADLILTYFAKDVAKTLAKT
ncbi:MAG: porphobilinogen synthase [Opitutaceae bacterium]|nr:porphobilinogen synthase [Opitutaceae bacterium]